MPEAEPTGQCGRGSGRNGTKAIAGTNSEAFARWLHHMTTSKFLTSVNNLSQMTLSW